MKFFALEAWKREPNLSDALTAAAAWEIEAAELLKRRPRCLTATYTEDDVERRWRQAASKRGASIIPWMRATAEQALDLAARARIVDYMDRAGTLVGSCVLATLAVMALEDRDRRAASIDVAPPRKAPARRPRDGALARRGTV